MIVLPNTPCTPKLLKGCVITPGGLISPETLSLRASINSCAPSNHADLTQYMLRIEQYLESIFGDLVAHTHVGSLSDIAQAASGAKLATTVPWTNIVPVKSAKPMRLQKAVVEWSVATEIVATIIAIAETYMRLGADLIDDLLDEEAGENASFLAKEVDQKWKSVAEYYKSAISLINFGASFQTAAGATASENPPQEAPHLPASPSSCPPVMFNPVIFALFDKICNIGIQMSILCKSSWMNRSSLSAKDSFVSSNNGVLCRVAIWIFNEVSACQNLILDLSKSNINPAVLGLNYDKWSEYLAVFFKYVTAYSGLFLAIEYYQKSKLGQAIGLINFSLLTLQSKNLGDTKKRGLNRIRSKISGRKNDSFVANLQSVTSIDIDKSVFSESSGAVLSDLSLLFDSLVSLHLKFSKENDNLRFEAVADWKDTRADSKWPLGAKIPVSPAKEYLPRAMGCSSGVDVRENKHSSYF
ncbi:hypothetical protein JCM33374_g3531 [Metschnikowia sp. JCM 33374]|nr:hypothetical protein JCM33374_g3531 [Metschnikowia sp. JCM 33374]